MDRPSLRRLKLRELHILRAAADCGSIAKAAHRMSMSQPGVSKAIAELESAVGARLLDRTRRGVEPTAAGRAMLARATNVFDELRLAADEIAFLADPSGGELHVGVTPPIGAGILPVILGEIEKRRPRIRHSVLESERDTLFREIRARLIDVALTRAPDGAHHELKFERLLEERIFVVAGLEHPLAAQRRVSPAELLAQRWIMPTPGTALHRQMSLGFERLGLPLPEAAVTSMSLLLRYELLAAAPYLTVVPGSFLHAARARPRLAVLPVDLPVSADLGVITLRERTPPPVVALFVECARDVVTRLEPIDAGQLRRRLRHRAAPRGR